MPCFHSCSALASHQPQPCQGTDNNLIRRLLIASMEAASLGSHPITIARSVSILEWTHMIETADRRWQTCAILLDLT
jgi:hypothetical protein